MPRECTKRDKLGTLVTKRDSNPKPPSQINHLQLLGAFLAVEGNATLPLLSVHAMFNGKGINPIVDTGATHNLASKMVVARLGLSIGKHTCRIKAINSKA